MMTLITLLDKSQLERNTYCSRILAHLVFFVCSNYELNAQQDQNYIAEIVDINQGEINLKAQSELNRGCVDNDTIILLPDTSFTNRKIDFSLNAIHCEDLMIVLNDFESKTIYGYRILENKVVILFDDLLVEGPFNGTDVQGESTTVSNIQTDIQNYRLEYEEPEVSFYLNDVLVMRSCIGDYSLNFEHTLIPASGTNATVFLSFESY